MSLFDKILNRNLDDVTPPKNLPVGTWTFRMSLKAVKGKGDDDEGYVQGIFQPVQPQSDVSADDLDDFGPYEDTKVFQRFWMRSKRDEWNMKQLLETAGVSTSGRTLLEAIQAADGYLVDAYVSHEAKKDDPEKVFERLTNFAAAV